MKAYVVNRLQDGTLMRVKMTQFPMRIIASLCVLLAASGTALAQGLPPSVTEPYVAYQTAMEAGDYAAAETAADLAWRAGESADIDLATTGLLADNYAQLAHRAGHYSEAVRGYMRSAEILTELNDDPFLIAQTWRLAAQSAYIGSDSERASSLADRAGDMFEGLPAGRDRSMELYRARLIQSYVNWEGGLIMPAGARAIEAIEALEDAGGDATPDTANLFFYAAIRYANERDNLEAAYYFSIANYIWRSMEIDGEAQTIANEWARYARREIEDDELDELVLRLSDSPYRPLGFTPEDDDDDTGTDWRAAYPDAQTYTRAIPSRRRPPQYPAQMMAAGFQGVALMQFDVTETGETKNIRVLFSVPHSDFGESAERAVRRWRYEPARVDGVAVPRQNVVTTVEYRMAE